MRILLPSLAVTCLVLAGCAGAPASGESSSTIAFDDLKGDATETTGLIRGVVVNPSIVPIPQALVSIAGVTKHNVTADDQGRFLVANLEPGTYLVKAKAPLHHEAQTTVEVVAGVDEPAITKIQLQPLFDQKPFKVPIKQTGYFDCSQGLGLPPYSSSNCVTNWCWFLGDPSDPADPCWNLQPLDNATSQEREWHMDVGEGWQQIVFEMTWKPSSQGLAAGMGMVVSTYKPTRDPSHSFANYQSCNPMRFQINVGEEGPGAANTEPTMIPAEGLQQVSYFTSVRSCQGDPGVAVALQQGFEVIIHQFYYGLPPEGWSFVNGDKAPF